MKQYSLTATSAAFLYTIFFLSPLYLLLQFFIVSNILFLYFSHLYYIKALTNLTVLILNDNKDSAKIVAMIFTFIW